MSFNLTTLGEYIEIQGGFAFKSKDLEPVGRCPVIKIKNVRDGFISIGEAAFVSVEVLSKNKRFLCNEGDILISMTGSGPNAPDSMVGRVARVKKTDLPALINQRVGRVVLNKNLSISKDFIYYCLSSKSARQYLVSNSTGSANQANIGPETIKSLKVPMMSFEESYQIGNLLSQFDKKIELNLQTNKTLEEIGKAIFRSWFVDFEQVRANINNSDIGISSEYRGFFPKEMTNSEFGQIPKGWKIKTLYDFGVQIESGKRPKGGIDQSLRAGVPSVGAESIEGLGNFDFRKVKYVSADFADKLNKGRFRDFDVALYKDGAGLDSPTPKVTLWGDGFPFSNFYVNEHIFLIRSESLGQPFLYYLFSSSNFWHQLSVKAAAKSAQPGLNQTEVLSSIFVDPGEQVRDAFNQTVEPIIKKQLFLGQQNLVLSQIRDTLLPKLISGELRIPDAEKFLEEAGI